MTSATDELRRLLDERGVEWMDKVKELELTLAGYADTRWNANGFSWCYIESGGTTTLASCRPIEIRGCTPEQAIAATLGSEREKALEELVQDWQVLYEEPDYGDCVRLRKRMQELGIEVIDE